MIGNLIKLERVHQNMKQNILAKGICSPSYLSKIENNQVQPNLEILQLLFNRLNLDFDILNTSTINYRFSYEELLSIYEEVIKRRNISFTEEKLLYLRKNQPNYFSTELFFNFKLLELYLLLILNKEPKNIELNIAMLSQNVKYYDREQAYLYDKCLGIYYYNKNQVHAADEAFERAWINIPLRQGGNYEQADLAYMSALTKLANNKFIQSIEMLEYSKNFFMNQVIFSRLAECLLIEGIAHQKLRNLEQAHDIYTQAMKLIENTDQNSLLAIIYQNLGSVNSSLDNLEESLIYFLKSYEMKILTEAQFVTIFSIIQLYSKLKQYDAMETWINKGLILQEKHKNSRTYYYHFKMYHYLFINQLGDLKFIKEALNYFESINDSRHVYKYGIKVSELLKKNQKYKLATQYYEQALFSQNKNVKYWEDL